jgi:hypothetical protein
MHSLLNNSYALLKMSDLSQILNSRFWEAITAVAAIANFGFLFYYVWQLYLRKLKFEIYIDNWAEVRHRCCDPRCQNPHIDFKCTLVAIGPKEKVEALQLAKTDFLCPSELKVEVSPNNHKTPAGEYWGNHTPLLLCGGEKKEFTVSYKPELENLKTGTYEMTVRLRTKNGKQFSSRIEKLQLSEEKLSQLKALQCHAAMKFEFEEHA